MVLIVPSGNIGIDDECKFILMAESAHSFWTYVTLPYVLGVGEEEAASLPSLPAMWTNTASEHVFLSKKWGSLD